MNDLKTVKLNIIKKNRMYFKCTTDNGYEVKLKITPESENLEVGTHELLVEDLSIRSKYGIDVIYSLKGKIEKDEGIIILKHRFNKKLVEKCNQLGGKWDSTESVWVFSKIVDDEVEELDYKYNANIATVEITALQDIYGDQDLVTFKGYPLAKASGRDSGAVVCEGVALICGSVTSGGSMKNWTTVIRQGSKFKLLISKNLIEGTVFEKWEVKIL